MAQKPESLWRGIFESVGNPHREKITEGPFWLLDFNCGVGSSSAAFFKTISASNKGAAPAMHVYAVDSNPVMVEATQKRLDTQILLLNGTPVVGTVVVGVEDANTPLALTGVGTDEAVGILPLTFIKKKRKSESSTADEKKKRKQWSDASLGNSPYTITTKRPPESSTPAEKKKKRKLPPSSHELSY
jgi:SAM-dependent methyltransferase